MAALSQAAATTGTSIISASLDRQRLKAAVAIQIDRGQRDEVQTVETVELKILPQRNIRPDVPEVNRVVVGRAGERLAVRAEAYTEDGQFRAVQDAQLTTAGAVPCSDQPIISPTGEHRAIGAEADR